MPILRAPTINFLSTTLNGTITDTVDTITLTSTANLQAPGAIVIDRVDANGVSQPTLREVINYTGIAGNDLTGCVRGADNSTARNHADGAIVETNVTVGVFNSLITAVELVADTNGYLRPLASPASLAILQNTTFLNTSIASIAQVNTQRLYVGNVTVTGMLNISGASVLGVGINPVFRAQGTLSGATTALGGLLVIPRVTTFNSFTVITRTVASAASIVFDFMKNGTSVFAGVTKPTLVGGGTFVSTASISVKAFLPGDILRFDLSSAAGVANITDVTGQARGD